MSNDRAAELLRSYLASRDIHCEGCHYNLRGASTVFCPECGRVIPRPPAEFMDRARADRGSLRLYCTECGYAVAGVNAERCPECGAAAMQRYSGEAPPKVRRSRLLPRGVPGLLAINAVVGIFILMPLFPIALGRLSGTPGFIGKRGDPFIGSAAAIAPLVILLTWLYWRRPLLALLPAERRAAAVMAFAIGVAFLLLALWMLR